jgi:hypothetical protein
MTALKLEEAGMVLKKIGVLSAAKVSGVLYGVIGLIAGVFFSVFSLFIPAQESSDLIFKLMFGVGGIIFLPILYGVMGVVAGLIGAALYNLIASTIGGLELELEN